VKRTLLSLLVCLSLCPWRTPATQEPVQQLSNAVALRVNGQQIGLRQVQAAFSDSWHLIGERAARGDLKPGEIEAAVRKGWTDALQTTVQDALLDSLATRFRNQIIRSFVARFDPATPPTRVMDSFARIEGDEVRRLRMEMLRAAGGEAELKAALKRKGQTLREWEKGIRRELFRREVVYMNVGYIVNSPRLARTYFEAHPEEFNQPDAWRLRRIRIPKERFTTPEAAAKAAALIHERLKSGQDFASLAASLGYDPQHERAGGLMMKNGKPDQPSGTFPTEEKIAAKLKNGEISDPVEAGEAILIVKREGYREGVNPTFEEASEKASALAYAAKVKEKKEEFFARQKGDAFIEIVLKEPPEQYLKAAKEMSRQLARRNQK